MSTECPRQARVALCREANAASGRPQTPPPGPSPTSTDPLVACGGGGHPGDDLTRRDRHLALACASRPPPTRDHPPQREILRDPCSGPGQVNSSRCAPWGGWGGIVVVVEACMSPGRLRVCMCVCSCTGRAHARAHGPSVWAIIALKMLTFMLFFKSLRLGALSGFDPPPRNKRGSSAWLRLALGRRGGGWV